MFLTSLYVPAVYRCILLLKIQLNLTTKFALFSHADNLLCKRLQGIKSRCSSRADIYMYHFAQKYFD